MKKTTFKTDNTFYKITEVDVEEREISNTDMTLLSLCENVHRKDLNPVELARGYNVALRVGDLGIPELAETIGISQNKIRSYLSILTLPQRILEKPDEYSVKELTCLVRANKYSKSLFIETEIMINEKGYPEPALLEISRACASIFESTLPEKRKMELAMQVLWEDYSSLGRNQYTQISEFGNQLLKEALFIYNEKLRKTIKAREVIERKRKQDKSSVRRIGDLRNPDRNLDRVINYIKPVPLKITTVMERDYAIASKKAKGRFNYWLKKLHNKLEELVKNE